MSGGVEQSKNILGANAVMAGGNASVVNLPSPSVDVAKLNGLLENYRREKASNAVFRQTIERLSYFKEYASDEIRRTLEEKLAAGNRKELIKHALRMKERFARRLIEHELYESAQAADAYLLGEVCTRFNNHVYPAIARGDTHVLVASLIESQVVDPLMRLLVDDDILNHQREEVYGMIFFLTGNCHINWD